MKHRKKSKICLTLLMILLLLTVSSDAIAALWSGKEKAGGDLRQKMIGVEILEEGVVILRWGVGTKEIRAEYDLVFQNVKNPPHGACSTRVARFRKVDIRNGKDYLFEGCAGGKRMPGMNADDDEDGEINEDRFDGVDNDGDGFIDEDFAAIGERMYVAQADLKESGGKVFNKCYTWAYEHVIDFVGVTTVFENWFLQNGSVRNGEETTLSLGINFVFGGQKSRDTDIYAHIVTEYVEFADDSLRAVIFSKDSLFAGVVLLESNPRGLIKHGIELALNSKGGSDSLSAPEIISAAADNRKSLRAHSVRFVLENNGDYKNGKTGKIDWAIFFASSEREIKNNLKMALKTYKGTMGEKGRINWIVPPRKIKRINLETKLATVWRENKKERAIVMKAPFGLIGKGIKWIKVDGAKTSNYTKAGPDILVPIERAAENKGDSIRVEGEFTNGILFVGETMSIAEKMESLETIPDNGRLPQSFMELYPNPFVEKVNVVLRIQRSSDIKFFNSTEIFAGEGIVRIYDVKGLLVRNLFENKLLSPGEYSVFWDGRDKNEKLVAPGVYYCNLQIGSRTLTKRIVLLR